MQGLSRTALPLLLPDVSAEDVVVLGTGSEAGPDGTRPKAPPGEGEPAGTPAAVAWFLDGDPERQPEAIEMVEQCLESGGTVVLIHRSAPLRADIAASVLDRLPIDSRNVVATFELHGQSFVAAGNRIESSLTSTSKTALLLDVARRVIPFGGVWQTLLPRWSVTLASGGRNGRPVWLQEILSRATTRGHGMFGLDRVRWVGRTQMGIAVAKIESAEGGRFAVKTGLNARADDSLGAQTTVLRQLGELNGLSPDVRETLPSIIHTGCIASRPYMLTRWLDTVPGARFMYSSIRRERALDAALGWITRFHQQTVGEPLDPSEAAAWARDVLARVGARSGARDERFEEELSGYLDAALRAHPLPGLFGHGDFWLGNIGFGSSPSDVKAVFDWDMGGPGAPPLEDVLHLLFVVKGAFSRYRPCYRLVRLLDNHLPARDQQRIAGYWLAMELGPASFGPAVAMYWLRFLDRRETQFARNRAWYREHFVSVRRAMQGRTEAILGGLGSRFLNHGAAD